MIFFMRGLPLATVTIGMRGSCFGAASKSCAEAEIHCPCVAIVRCSRWALVCSVFFLLALWFVFFLLPHFLVLVFVYFFKKSFIICLVLCFLCFFFPYLALQFVNQFIHVENTSQSLHGLHDISQQSFWLVLLMEGTKQQTLIYILDKLQLVEKTSCLL